ncbi:MAG: multidrug effflux MFS transporter [Rhodospirillaceae bacterium]
MRPRSDSLAVAALLTALVAIGPLSTDMYLPALPALMRSFGGGVAPAQFTLSIFLIGFAFGQLLCGPLSDRFGRRPVLLGGMVLYAVASVGCALAADFQQLAAARLLQALGACCGPVLGRAVVRDVYGREGAARMFAYMAMAMALAPAVAPMLGGVMTQWPGWRAIFLVLGLIGLALAAAVALMLSETNSQLSPDAVHPGRLLSNYLLLLGERCYCGYLLCFAGVFSSLFAFISGSSFVLIDRFGLSPVGYGLSFGVVVLGYMIGSFVSGRLTVRRGIGPMILAGLGITNAGGLLGLALALAGVDSVPAIVGPMALVMIGAGLVLPNAMAGAIAPYGAMAGTASALVGFAQMLLAALAGIIIGQFGAAGALPMMLGIALANLLALLAYRALAAPPRP